MTDLDWDDLTPVRDVGGSIFELPEPPAPDTEYDEPDDDFLVARPRPRGAKTYEKKTVSFLNTVVRFAIANPATVPDACAILMYGPDLAEKTGDLAAQDKRIARAIDFLADGTENPYAAFFTAVAPLVFQTIRNHEPQLEVKPRGLRIPFTKGKRIGFKFGIKLGRLRPVTHDPAAFANHVLSNPKIIEKLAELDIVVASSRGNQ